MHYIKLVKLWYSIVIGTLILTFGFNYIIDPYSQNNKFLFKFNKIKFINDDVSFKFIFTKNKEFNTYSFGSSRTSTIDPDLIEKNLVFSRAINASFGSASLDEIKKFIDSTILNTSDFKYVFIGLDFFQFSENWIPTRPISAQNLIGSNENNMNYVQYINLKTVNDSIKTLIYNSRGQNFNEQSCNLECMSYKKKGMRYYSDFLNNGNYNTQKKVTDGKHYWLRESYDYSQVLTLKNILNKLRENNVTVFIYFNPITFQQIYLGTSFFEQLNLIDDIVSNTDAKIYDFNNLNMVNLNNSYFLDPFHFNYKIADCIVNKITLDKSECGHDFGEIIDKNNISAFKHRMKNKYFDLMDDENLWLTPEQISTAKKLAREWIRKNQ